MHEGFSMAELEIRFLELKWPELVEDARATLANMLSTGISQELKDTIFDALIKDEPLRKARLTRAATAPSNSRIGKMH
jgi:hypothetical protein